MASHSFRVVFQNFYSSFKNSVHKYEHIQTIRGWTWTTHH